MRDQGLHDLKPIKTNHWLGLSRELGSFDWVPRKQIEFSFWSDPILFPWIVSAHVLSALEY